jgi:hypothetical protein
MSVIPDPRPAVMPQVIAGLLLLAREFQQQAALPHATVAEILAQTTARRSAAYAVRQRLAALLPTLCRPAGRPPTPAVTPPPATDALTPAVLRFVMDHPGCVHGSPARRQYAAAFRRFLVELRAKHAALDLAVFAVATGVPLDTLRDWERVPAAPAAATPCAPSPEAARPATDPLHIETVLAAWRTWEGDLAPFCTHVREHLLVPFGRTAITAILAAHGVRQPHRRTGRSPDESALRKSFETFFPGAQWVGDGTLVTVTVDGERFMFNFELIVDAASAACVGASIRDAEDGPALTAAVADGITTTGAPPLALLVDNRPSNLTPKVAQTVADDDIVLIPATPARPQNKGHIEGAFGLFFQMLPALTLAATTPRELARQILRLVIITWGRTLNGRPRRARGGLSRRELYAAQPTPDKIAAARTALNARLRRQLAARQTAQSRLDPLIRQHLAATFTRLGFSDPNGQLQTAIARYPLAAIVDGVAIFDGKRAAGTLPPDVDARYLLGIVRNVALRREAEEIATAMLRARLAAQDAILTPLVARHQALMRAAATPADRAAQLVDAALQSDAHLARLFWLHAAGDCIRTAPPAERPTLYTRAARIINTAPRLRHADRLELARSLAHRAFPLASPRPPPHQPLRPAAGRPPRP